MYIQDLFLSCLRRSFQCSTVRGGAGFGEDLGVSTTEVVGVEGGGVVEILLVDTAEGKRQGGGGGGLGDEARRRILAQGFGNRGLADYDDGSGFEAENAKELVTGEEGFAEAGLVEIDTAIELATTGIEEGVNLSPLIALPPPIAMRLR